MLSSARRCRRSIWIVGALAVLAALALPGRALAAACQTSGPTAGNYTATVCISAPSDGAIVTGATPVTATVSFTGTPPSGIQRLIFSLDGQYLLTDYSSPYSFTLPSDRFVDGTKTLSVVANMRDGFSAQAASISLNFSNGVTTPPVNTNQFTVATGTTPAPGQPFVLAAAGDGAGGEQSETDVVNLIKGWNPNLFLYLGDVYEKGSPTEFYNWYATPGWYGDLRSITDPTVGNHEYTSSANAAGYFDYWNNIPHYFSFNAGNWHIVSLDANGIYGQVAAGTGQYNWLAADLAANTQPCTIVYYHQPRWNVGQEGDTPSLQDLWSLMAQDGVDVVLNGHDHTYQRWQPLDGSGNPALGGVTEFVTGTGGHALGGFVRSDSRIAAQAVQFGALRMELRPDGADWEFITSGGTTLDSGALQCSGTPADTTPPTTPGSLSATSPAYNDVDLSWSPSNDNVGIAGYDIYRDGTKIASVGLTTSYSDRTVSPGTTYQYTVVARDPAGNTSAASTAASVTTQLAVTQFSDDFETGNLSKWSTSSGLAVESTLAYSGTYAVEAASTGLPAYADATLKAPQTDLYSRTRFYVASQASNPVNLLKLRTSTGGKLVTLLLGSTGRLSYRNDQTAVTQLSSTVPTQGTWHKLEVHVVVNGTASKVEIWLDDVKVPDLGGTDSLGTAPAGSLELGDSGSGRTFDVFFDDVNAVTSTPVDVTPPTAPTGLTATAPSGGEVDLAWTAATDNVGVNGYDVFRNGTKIASVAGSATSYADLSVAPHTSYTYQVQARDAAGNVSPLSNVASVTTPAFFSDGFETGDLSRWTSVSGLVVQQQLVYAGAWAARATTTGGAGASAYKQLSTAQNELFYHVRFRLVSHGANPVNFIRFRTATGSAIGTVSVSTTNKLTFRDDVAALATTSSTVVTTGVWHDLEAHVVVGASSLSEVWLDGVKIDALTRTDSLGSNPVGRIELGDPSTGRTSDVAFDDVEVDTP